MRASLNPVPGRQSGFGALSHRNFRLFWLGGIVSATGTWMQIVALSLLVLDLAHDSPIALGTVPLAQGLSFLLFSPLGGGVADRFDKRRLILLTQSLLMALALLLGLLTAAGAIRFWMIPIAAFMSGTILSFDQPARNALVASLVPKESLMNAVSLQSAVFNGASTIGPILAGKSLATFGYSGNFLINGLSYLAVIAALIVIRPASSVAVSRGGSLWKSVREALGYVKKDLVLPSALMAYGALLFFGPSMQFMLPLFVRQMPAFGPEWLGTLLAAAGAGTVIGALAVASLGDVRYKGWLLFGSLMVWATALAIFVSSSGMVVAITALALMGASQTAAGATVVTLLQTRVPPEMRGRAMSLNTLLIMCVRPLGDFVVSGAIAGIGLRPAGLTSAALVGISALTLLVSRPAARRA